MHYQTKLFQASPHCYSVVVVTVVIVIVDGYGDDSVVVS